MLRNLQRTILAALVGVGTTGIFCGEASAVMLSQVGRGQVLLYPYYTAQRGTAADGVYRTRISVFNDAVEAKALRVRFMEGENSRTVLEFNLFLGPMDSWSGMVVAPAGDGEAGVVSDDTSCTDPVFSESGAAIGASASHRLARFSSAGYQGDGGSPSPNRTREGHVEVIAMADLMGSLAVAVTADDVSGMPAHCPAVVGLQGATSHMLPPTAGIRGRADIVNIRKGVALSYEADALSGFTHRELFAPALQPSPRLTDANDDGYPETVTASVLANDRTMLASYPQDRAIDAVSAALMATTLCGDFQVQTGVVDSEWVIAYPTKRYYTDPLYTTEPIRPFLELFNGGSCSQADPYWFDAAGRTNMDTCGGFPMILPPTGQRLCKAATVAPISPSPSVVYARSPILGSANVANQYAIFQAGRLELKLASCWSYGQMRPSVAPNADRIFVGQPVIGFSVTHGGQSSAKTATQAISSILPYRRSLECRTAAGTLCP